MKFPPGFYVYRLIDPRTCLPFYVGKGQRGRAWRHQWDVERGAKTTNARKDARIRGIIAVGRDVEIEIVACYESEVDALDHEFRLVDADPTLTNVAPGGGGLSPLALEQKAKKLAELRRRRELFRARAMERDDERRREHFLKMRGAVFHEAEIKEWLEHLRQSGIRTIYTAPEQKEDHHKSGPKKKVRPRNNVFMAVTGLEKSKKKCRRAKRKTRTERYRPRIRTSADLST